MLSPLAKANLYLNLFGFFKVPLIWACRPRSGRVVRKFFR